MKKRSASREITRVILIAALLFSQMAMYAFAKEADGSMGERTQMEETIQVNGTFDVDPSDVEYVLTDDRDAPTQSLTIEMLPTVVLVSVAPRLYKADLTGLQEYMFPPSSRLTGVWSILLHNRFGYAISQVN